MLLAHDRRLGMMIGLAVGDALGAAVEFRARGTFLPVTGYRSGGPHHLDAGGWTDDTSMALALADSLAQGFSEEDQIRRYADWMEHGRYSVNGRCFDIGITTRRALRGFLENGKAVHSGDPSERASGNGSIMRLAPVVVRFARLAEIGEWSLLAELADRTGLVTHPSPICRSACRYLATLLAGLALGLDREKVLDPCWGPVAGLVGAGLIHPALLPVVNGSFRTKSEAAIRGSGYVVDSLEAALWSFWQARSFEDAVLRAVNLGDDADTTGAVCGQIAGAHFGMRGIPETFRDGLSQRGYIEDLAQQLIEAVEPGREPSPSPVGRERPHGPALAAGPILPFDRSYWVVPGKLLAGFYPGERDQQPPEVASRKLRALLDAGIRSIVDLTEEGELCPYKELALALVSESGVEIECIRLEIRDVNVPSREKMKQILDTIDDAVARGRPVYVHCWGGKGRTGTVVGCYLARHGIATGHAALDRITHLRRGDARAYEASPRTAAQREMVTTWSPGG